MEGARPGRGLAATATALLPIASLALLVVTGEGVCRVMGYGQMVRYDYVPELGWIYGADQRARTRVGGWTIRINSAGLRGPEYEIPKPAGVFRILLLGDSFTFGYGVAEDSTYGAQLESLLSAGGPGCRAIQVINGGVEGYNTGQEIALLRDIGLAYRPDIVIVGFTPNDLVDADEAKTMLRWPGLKQALARSALYQFLAPRLRALVSSKKRRAYDELLSGLGQPPDSQILARWAGVRVALEELQGLAVRNSFRPLVALFPFWSQVYEDTSPGWPETLFADFHSRSGVPVLDLAPGLRAAAAHGEQLFLEEPTQHPNPRGHRIAAEQVRRFLTMAGFVPRCATPSSAPATSGRAEGTDR